MSDIQLILFDWSGTLSDDRRVVHTSYLKMCDYYGITPVRDLRLWLNEVNRGPQEYFHERGVTDSSDAIWKVYVSCLENVLATGLAPALYTDVPQVLGQLSQHGIKLGVVSSHPYKNLYEESVRYGIAGYFDIMVGDVYDKAIAMEEVAEQLSITPEHTIYIGDIIQDVLAARRARVYPIAVSRGYHSEKMLQSQAPLTILPDLRSLYAALPADDYEKN